MQTLPDFRIGLLNGWLPLALYFAGLLLAVAFFSAQARERLFEDPKYRMPTSVKGVPVLFVQHADEASCTIPKGTLLDQRLLLLTIWCAIWAQDVVKPQRWFFAVGIIIFPGINGLSLASHQAPVNSPDFAGLEIRHDGLKGVPRAARQIFGTHHRPSTLFQVSDDPFCIPQVEIGMKGDNVTQLKANRVELCT